MPDINFTDFYQIDTVDTTDYGSEGFQSLSPEEYGVGGGNNFDLQPDQLTCREIVNQWCSQRNNCIIGADGLPTVNAVDQSAFRSNYPECDLNQIENEPVESNLISNMNKEGMWDINSPNFLGGPNVHSLIIIVLAVLVLASVTRGNIFKGIATATKDVVK